MGVLRVLYNEIRTRNNVAPGLREAERDTTAAAGRINQSVTGMARAQTMSIQGLMGVFNRGFTDQLSGVTGRFDDATKAANGFGGGLGIVTGMVGGLVGGLVSGALMSGLNLLSQGFQTCTEMANRFVQAIIDGGARAQEDMWRLAAVWGSVATDITLSSNRISDSLGGVVGGSDIAKMQSKLGLALQTYGVGQQQISGLAEYGASAGIITGRDMTGDLEAYVQTGRGAGLRDVGFKVPDNAETLSPLERANSLIQDNARVTKLAAGYQDTWNGQMQRAKVLVGDVFESFKPLIDRLTPWLEKGVDMFASYVDVLGPYAENIADVAGRILDMINELFQGSDTGAADFLRDWAEGAAKAIQGLGYVIAGVLNILKPIWETVEPYVMTAINNIKGGLEWLANTVLAFGKLFYLVTGILTSSTGSMGDKIKDILMLIGSQFLDWGISLVNMLADTARSLVLGGISLASSLVNAIIDGLNSGGVKIVGWLNQLTAMIREKSGGKIDFGAATWTNIGHISSQKDDVNTWMSSIESSRTLLTGMLEGLRDKYGLNVTVDSLANKYGVDMSIFDDLIKATKENNDDGNNNATTLADILTQLNDTVAGKNMKSEVNFYPTFTINGPMNTEQQEDLMQNIEDKFLDALRKAGIASRSG